MGNGGRTAIDDVIKGVAVLSEDDPLSDEEMGVVDEGERKPWAGWVVEDEIRDEGLVE